MTDTLFGRQFEQSYDNLYAIDQLLLKVRPKSIIEVGTGEGGFALYLATFATNNLEPGMLVVTFDPEDRNKTKAFLQESSTHVDFIQASVLEWSQTIQEFIENNKPAIVFCDPTKKFPIAKEVAGWLSPGDYLLVHDFLHPENGGMTEDEAKVIEAMEYERYQQEKWAERGSWLCLRKTNGGLS